MTTSTDVVARPRVLADLVPGALARDIALVVGAAALTGLAAQVSIPLPFTPVPISLQTFTVLLSGAALGPIRGGLAMGLYLIAGIVGVPWLANSLAVDLPTALELGAWPFLIGDALKIALAAGLLPAAWWFARSRPEG